MFLFRILRSSNVVQEMQEFRANRDDEADEGDVEAWLKCAQDSPQNG